MKYTPRLINTRLPPPNFTLKPGSKRVNRIHGITEPSRPKLSNRRNKSINRVPGHKKTTCPILGQYLT